MHVHVWSVRGAAKVWVEPQVRLDRSRGFSSAEQKQILSLIRAHAIIIKERWHEHFSD